MSEFDLGMVEEGFSHGWKGKKMAFLAAGRERGRLFSWTEGNADGTVVNCFGYGVRGLADGPYG